MLIRCPATLAVSCYGLSRKPEVYVRLSRRRWADASRIGDTAVVVGAVETDDKFDSGFEYSNLILRELSLWFLVFRQSSVRFCEVTKASRTHQPGWTSRRHTTNCLFRG